MSMATFFPSLKTPVQYCLWFELDAPCNEEAEVNVMESAQQNYLCKIGNTATEIMPLGKVLTIVGPETDDEEGNDDSDESDSHDEEDEDDIDRLMANTERVRMETETPNNEEVIAAIVGAAGGLGGSTGSNNLI